MRGMPPSSRVERRLSLLLVGAVVVVFSTLLIIVPALFETFDEAKYVGIGFNVLAGKGVVSVYGPFLAHSPLWAVVLAAADNVAGIDPFAWGHLLNGLSGIGLILLTAWFGWRYRPAAGALAATAMLGFTYLHDLTRTARLDVPAAALALLYLAVGLAAVRRASARWGLLAGAIFAVAFLVKEIALPFAPVPFLAGLIAGRRLPALARVGGATLLMAMAGTAWWFVVFASYEHTIYRLGVSDSYLGPLAVLLVGISVVGLAAEPIAASTRARTITAWFEGRVPAASRSWRRPVGWALAVTWFVALLISFAQNQGVRGLSLFSLAQYRQYASTWLSPITLAAAAYAMGAIVIAWARLRRDLGDAGDAVSDLLLTLLCSAPLVLLVVAVGEPPRNYFAQIGLVIALASSGWVWLAGRLAGPDPTRPPLRLGRGSWVAWLAAGAFIGAIAGYGLDRVDHVIPARFAVVIGALIGSVAGTLLGWLVTRGRGGTARAVADGSGANDRSRGRHVGLIVGLLVPLIITSAVLSVHALRYRASASGAARAAAIQTTTDWIKANVPRGSKIAFGSFLGYEMNLPLQGRYPTVQIAQKIARFTPSAPLGIGVSGRPAADDWLSVDIAPRNVAEFQAFQASATTAALMRGVDYWVYNTGTTTSAPTILAALTPDHGFDLLADWSFPVIGTSGKQPQAVLHSYVFKVDRGRLTFVSSRVYMAPDAAERLIGQLEQDPVAARPIAARLLDRIEITPAGSGDAALLARLRRLAGQ